MTDQRVKDECCLYRLTTLPGLEWFQNVVLVCSFQDQYAPFDSTRIQICKQVLSETIQADGTQQPAGQRDNFYVTMA